MELLMFTFKDLLNPEFYILNGGLWVMLFIIFAETGLFAGFFLPGDSLLFVAGIYSSTLITVGLGLDLQNEFLHLLILTVMVTLCGIAGNFVGYWFGRKSGPALYKRKDSLLFKQKYLERAHEFYDRRGTATIFIARFLPIIRTFAPIVAGIVKMDRNKFALYNIVGCIAWTVSMLFAGHYLDKLVYESLGIDLKKHLEVIVLSIIFVTTAPVIAKLFFSRKK